MNVLYGSDNGLTATGNQIWDKNSAGVQGSASANDRFGLSVIAGNFNQDNFADLAIGSSGENGAGATNILYGSANGLVA